MMRLRNIIFFFLLLPAWGCDRDDVQTEKDAEGVWEFVMTRSGGAEDRKVTYRTSLLNSSNGNLMSDGTYCGYHKPQGWLYPCSADDETGAALDAEGNAVDAGDADWIGKIDKDSRHALRAAANQTHVLVLSSPAVRMQKYKPDGSADTWHWGFPVDRRQELFIGNPIKNLGVTATWLDGKYIFPVVSDSDDGTLYDRRARLTVKVACGALLETDINAVYFRNVISSAYYLPISKTYENAVMDGGSSEPLKDYFEAGEKLAVAADEPDIHITKGNTVAAIESFPIMALDYSTLDGDQYRYKDLIPEIIVLSGTKGNIRSTVSLAADLDPMKEYVVMIYMSTASVQATLQVAGWEEGSDTSTSFGEGLNLPVTSISVDDWEVNPDHPVDDGKITNPS